MMRVGIDAHKRNCTTLVFADGEESPIQSFDFKTTRAEVLAMLEKIPEKSVFVIESSTTGKAITKMISSFGSTRDHVVHMVAPPEKKASVKTDKRDCERIVKEDALGYLRRCYVPSPEIEDMRFLVTNQIEIGAKISRVKNQIQSLLERNMVQYEFSEFSDVFTNGGLQKLGEIELPKQDKLALAMHLSELKFYATQHTQVETEIAKMAERDQDCQLLISHPGISAFTALAIKGRIGDASRFPTKKHLCSYAGVVPGADNSGEHESHHEHVKHGDIVLKYALTVAVRAAVRAKKDSAVKRIYLRQIKRGKAPQEAQVDAARKLACIVWKILTSKQRYVEEDKYLTVKKVRQTSYNAKRVIKDAVLPEDVPELAKNLSSDIEVLEQYSTGLDRMLGRHNRRRNKSSDRSDSNR